MKQTPDTETIDFPPLAATLSMPYTLTPGLAAGTFLAEIANRRLVGSRCAQCAKVNVPAQDFCPACGGDAKEMVEAPHTATLVGFTETKQGLIGLVLIDGADFPMAHKIVDAAYGDLKIGDRMGIAWAAESDQGILAIKGFRPAPKVARGEIKSFSSDTKPVQVKPYSMDLHYQHAVGPFYGRFFDEIKNNKRIVGVRCPSCENVLIPPREFCDICHVRTGVWAEVKDTGTVRACSVIHMEFIGQSQPPPYIYAEIQLDGAATRLVHQVSGIDMTKAKELVKPGTRVRAVWKDARIGALSDIRYFEPLLD